MIPIKAEEDLRRMREAGKILAEITHLLVGQVKVGITTLEINNIARDLMQQKKVCSAFKGYQGFPADICTSVNEEIVHGIPGDKRLKETDIISLDLGIKYEGFCSDLAVTLSVGKAAPQIKKLVEVTKRALLEGIKQAKVNNYVSDISFAVQNYVEKHGFSVVRQFVGHGIGQFLHEDPEIPNFGRPHQGSVLKEGMVLAIEPMVNLGSWECEVLSDGWTAVTKDRRPSAHFEHTIAVTEKGPEILTQYN